MKALVGAFNQEKALVGAFSVIVQPVVEPMEHYTALICAVCCAAGGYSSGQQIVNSTEVITVTSNWTRAWTRPPASRWPRLLHTVLADMK